MSEREKGGTEKRISRRSFLTGAAVATAGAALATGLTACSQGSSSGTPDAGGDALAGDPAPAPRWSWVLRPYPIPESEIAETIDTEIVVVGAGVAGMAAAWWAAKKGAQIHVIEKMDKPSSRSNQIGAVNCSVQKEAGIPDFPINEILQYMKAFQGGYVKQELLKQYLYNSARMWDTIAEAAIEDGHTPVLLDRGGEGVYVVDTPMYKEYRTMANIYATNEEMLARFQKDTEAAGTVYHFNTPAEQLVVEGDKVVGVVAKGPSGYIRINGSKGIIMATGDYSGDPEMMERWGGMAKYSDATIYSPPGANTGDGLKMMMWVGGSMQPSEEHAPMIHCLMGAFTCPNPWLRVNIYGERYENEDVPNAQVCYGRMMQPGNKAWAIFDANYKEYAVQHTPGFGREKPGPTTPEDITEQNLEADLLVGGVSLDMLAAVLNIPADALKATVSRYNELVARGEDVDFGKDPQNLTPIDTPPFYAAKIVAPLLCMVGGINVDGKYRVLAEDGSVVENLYAIGNVSGNYYAVDYPTIMAGQSHGRCLTAGMVLGEALAEGRLVEPIVP
ncbi:MAG: FAD-dependent oxidoreductase [Coriobacteriales bacterium]|jgi:fumarate reductase flavoprotein subunit|nr:FAD-dependent oxidoreductase [Coriobacteriales bacterium]